jgi:peptide/nickel transport system substrate-binding protein
MVRHAASTQISLAGMVVLAGALGIAPAAANTFKWASASDIPTWDIHSQNNALANGVHAAVYESLFYYNKKFELEPLLGTGFKQMSPTQVRITLRQGVKFHDGSAFNADDAKFSLERAMSKSSNYGVYTQGIERVARVDEYTIDIITKGPNPVLQRQLTELRMMDQGWAQKHNSVEPKDIKTKDENFAHRNANGTGPFMLKSWEQDVKLVLVKNPAWWGKAESNLTEIVYTPIKAEATRVAALLSGEVDMVLDPSPADLAKLRAAPNLKVVDGAENRTLFFGMDQFREELPGSNVKGKNPLKDLRVRKALYQAIDIQTLARVTMRGLAQPTGALIAPQVNGWSKKADARWPYDVEAAKKLAPTTATSTTKKSARR